MWRPYDFEELLRFEGTFVRHAETYRGYTLVRVEQRTGEVVLVGQAVDDLPFRVKFLDMLRYTHSGKPMGVFEPDRKPGG